LSGEQSNTTIVFGNTLILKLLRRVDGVSPDLEMGHFLTVRHRFIHAAPLLGWIEYRGDNGEPTTLALLHRFIPNRGDAWRFSQTELRRYFERALARKQRPPALPLRPLLDALEDEPPAEVRHTIGAYLEAAHLLGRRVAELHAVLASEAEDSAFVPEPDSALHQRALFQSRRNLVGSVFRLLRLNLAALPEGAARGARQLLRDEGRVVARFETARRCPASLPRIRCHGDLHLGQVLYTGKDFVFIDFEGEPARTVAERRHKRSCLNDVAGMLRSFHYASATALQETTDRGIVPARARESMERYAVLWQAWTSLAFLRSYRETSSAAALPENRAELRTLLGAALLEKSIYELGYELNHRPGWTRIPIQGIRQILGAGSK
jgi:maltose alpha-D-glucosyltransferase / alpha-amylase